MMLRTGKILLLVLASVCFELSARPISKRHATLYDYLTSGDFSCRTLSKRILKPGETSQDYAFESKDPICLVRVHCDPVAGVEATDSESGHDCGAPQGVCEDILTCAVNEARRNKEEPNRWAILDLASVAKSKTNKFNDSCKPLSTLKNSSAAFQFFDGQDVAEQVCVTSYSCGKTPGSTHVACATTKEQAIDKSGRTHMKTVCPQLNDCLNAEIQMPLGYTKKELDAMPPHEKEKAIKKLAEKPLTAAERVSSTVPRNAGASTTVVTYGRHSGGK